MAQTYVAGQGQDKATDSHATDSHHNQNFWSLTVGSIGVVYGDIGTSPLYAFKEAMLASKEHGMDVRTSVIGILSLIIWALILIVTIKYVLILLRADNKGEGGTFALMALGQSVAKRSAPVLFALGIAGVSFFYGDAVITPAMSVLSAVEGLELVHPTFKKVVIPLTCVILVGLFAMQSRGTAKVAAYFGPITVLWFLVLGLGGLMHIVDDPSVLKAFNPWPGMKFIGSHGLIGLTIMGLVFLAVTGAEALYADLGHFGRKPIQFAWLSVVLPALLLNYLGQGAMVLSDPKMLDDKLFNPFYKLYPEWALIPMIILATIATVIASQAVITGAFSLTRQAVQLGLLPRLAIKHTSENMAGQIYLPRVNWLILVCVLAVVFIFGSSSRLAAAYGISVTAAMVIDSLMAFFVVWKYWKWPLWQAALVILPLALIEQAFLTANMVKVLDGGWFPIMIAATTAMIMLTWHKGSQVLAKETRKNDWLIRKLESKPPHRVPGTAVFLTSDPSAAPTALMHNLKHNRVLHERNIILSIKVADSPRVLNSERIHIDKLSDGFVRVTASFGFMETPSIPKVLTLCRKRDLNIEMAATSFFLSRRSLRPTNKSELPAWQEQLFIGLAGSAQDATTYFQIPTDRVVEVGTQVAV
jgi:KUP system potassium uptake protein